MLRNQVPWWPEHVLTRRGGAAVEQLVRSRAGAAWPATEDFAQSVRHMRTAIQIPSAAHSALEYQRWAARSQVRGEGRRFMRAMKQRTAVHAHAMRRIGSQRVVANIEDDAFAALAVEALCRRAEIAHRGADAELIENAQTNGLKDQSRT